jgi:hypothetical protein
MPEFSDRRGSWRLQGFSKDYWRLSLCVLGRLQNSSRTVGVAVRSSEYWKYLEINELINNFHELCIQYIIFNCVCKSLTLMILMFSRSCLKRYENFNLKYFWACFGHVGRVVKSFLLRFGSMKTDWTLLTSLVVT